jgi:hypothetical protein
MRLEGLGQSEYSTKTVIGVLRPDFYYCRSLKSLYMWGPHYDERTGLSCTIVVDPRQRIHSRVRVPLESWTHSTVSDSRLPVSSPPPTRRATVEVLDPASTRERLGQLKIPVTSLGITPTTFQLVA